MAHSNDILDVRYAHPNIEAEIRSILLTHAREGATIEDIKYDFHKLNDEVFPIQNNIVEFLLNIPTVTARYDKGGIRFNIIPSEKTKHIFDMICQQKPYQPVRTLRNNFENYSRPPTPYSETNSNGHLPDNYYAPYERMYSNSQGTSRASHSSLPSQSGGNTVMSSEHYQQLPQLPEEQKAENIFDGNIMMPANQDMFAETHCYQDNCAYLYNRLRNLPNPAAPPFVPRFHNTMTTTTNCQPFVELQPPPIYPTPAPTPVDEAQTQNQQPPIQELQTQTQLQPPREKFHYQHLQFQEPLPQHLQHYSARFSEGSRGRLSDPCSSGAYSRSSTSPRSNARNESWLSTESDYEAHLLDFLLLGDDFFLYMARMELKCKFKKNTRPLQSGLCISGQTISAATKRIKMMNSPDRKVILNIGSVDILKGKQLVQIEHDFRELVHTILRKRMQPILTTIAPLANYSHVAQTKDKVERFNAFIKKFSNYLIVIDIWSVLTNARGQIFFDCFQNEPRLVTGAKESYVFWNKIGRQRVLQFIESHLEY